MSNLIVNGNFETGDLTGWTQIQTENVFVSSPGFNSNYCYFIGNYNSFSPLISQSFNTTIGENYTLSYYLKNGTTNGYYCQFSALINNVTVNGSYINTTSPFDWTLYTFNFMATTSVTVLSFNSYIQFLDPTYFYLDSVSVVVEEQPFELIYNNSSPYSISLNLGVPNNITITWGDGNTNVYNSAGSVNATHTYSAGGSHTVQITGISLNTLSTSQYLTTVTNFGSLGLTYISFQGANTLTSVPSSLPSSITNMTNMFNGATIFNQNISNWNVTNVTNMSGMFASASSFNQPLNSWNTSNVTSMQNMFADTTTFNQDLSSWIVSNVTTMQGMFTNVPLYIEYFDNMLNAWSAEFVQPNVILDANLTYYTTGNPGYNILTSAPNSWTINTGSITVSSIPSPINANQPVTIILTLTTSLIGGTYYLINTANSSILSTTTIGAAQTIVFDNVIIPNTGTYVLSVQDSSFVVVINGITIEVSAICFKEDTHILCLRNKTELYVPIQRLKKGDLVKTALSGYVPIDKIIKTQINNRGTKERIKDQLYKCSRNNYPELFEDLVITGRHAILVNNFVSKEQVEDTIRVLGNIYVTDNKYRLPACVDKRATPFEKKGTFNIYHFSLENNDCFINYGVYANGLLVETCSKKELSKMEILN